MYKKIIIYGFLFCGLAVTAQVPLEKLPANVNVFPKETTHLVLNNNLLLAGETLLYKVDNLTNSKTNSTLSKIAYVSLKNNEDSVVFLHKLKLRSGMAHSDFFIPASLKTGKYNLIAYTNFSKNNTENVFAQEEIYVINSFRSNDVPIKSENQNITKIEASNLSENRREVVNPDILIKPDASSYKKRERVTLNVQNTLDVAGYGNYSVSVRKIDALQITKSHDTYYTKPVAQNRLFFIPELRGELISGKVEVLKSDASLENIIIGLTIPGKDFIFKIAKTNALGQFFFSIDEPYQTANCVIQIEGIHKDDYKLVLDSKEILTEVSNKQNEIVILDMSIEPWLEGRNVELQIENAYFNTKDVTFIPETPSAPFYGNLGTEYILDDYTRFPSVEETFVEVISLAGTRKVGSATKFVVFNAYDPEGKAQFSSYAPLLLMDGILVQNPSDVLAYNSANIKSIRVLPEAYKYGTIIYSGIIAITTTKGNFKLSTKSNFITEFELQSLKPTKQFNWPDYSTQASKRIPDYRNQLFWEPILNLTSNKETLVFYTSDVTGLFEIVLQGYTNTGDYIISKEVFSVE